LTRDICGLQRPGWSATSADWLEPGRLFRQSPPPLIPSTPHLLQPSATRRTTFQACHTTPASNVLTYQAFALSKACVSYIGQSSLYHTERRSIVRSVFPLHFICLAGVTSAYQVSLCRTSTSVHPLSLCASLLRQKSLETTQTPRQDFQ
jgi:hypothetical protein